MQVHNSENPVRVQDNAYVELRASSSDPDQVHEAAEDLGRFFRLFAERSREYGDHAFVLGSAGQYADMSRKFGKVKTAMWDKKPEQLTSENIEEVLMDLIGHCLLSLQCLRREGVLAEYGMKFRGEPFFEEGGEKGEFIQANAEDVLVGTIDQTEELDLYRVQNKQLQEMVQSAEAQLKEAHATIESRNTEIMDLHERVTRQREKFDALVQENLHNLNNTRRRVEDIVQIHEAVSVARKALDSADRVMSAREEG